MQLSLKTKIVFKKTKKLSYLCLMHFKTSLGVPTRIKPVWGQSYKKILLAPLTKLARQSSHEWYLKNI
jgi:hypothetical protein